MISSPVPMPLYTDAKRACEDEDRELRRQAILGIARIIARHALSPQSRAAKGAPLRAVGIDRSARPSKKESNALDSLRRRALGIPIHSGWDAL